MADELVEAVRAALFAAEVALLRSESALDRQRAVVEEMRAHAARLGVVLGEGES